MALKRSPQRFKELVEKQVVRREIADEEKDFDKRWRGKQIVRGRDLRKLFEQAVAREPAKRKAVHRREKVQQLCQVIEGFINYGTRMSDDEKKTIIQKWQRELAGELDQDVDPRRNPSGLLNKVIRAPRFENRVKSSCAWCGRTCARRSKNRRIAYLAAVNNLSVCEIPPYRQNLTSAQKAQLLTLWRAGEHNPAEARQKFLGRCRHFGVSREKQNAIAKLFGNWDANGAAAEAKIDKLKANVGGRKPPFDRARSGNVDAEETVTPMEGGEISSGCAAEVDHAVDVAGNGRPQLHEASFRRGRIVPSVPSRPVLGDGHPLVASRA